MPEEDNGYVQSADLGRQAAKRLQKVEIMATLNGDKGKTLDYLNDHPEHATRIASEIDKLIDSYNSLQVTADNRDILLSSTTLKKTLPHLPLIKDILAGTDPSASNRDWRIAYLKAIRTSADRMGRGTEQGAGMDEDALIALDEDPDVYVHHLFDTHPKAMLLAMAYHLYEDTVDRSPEYAGRVPGKDTVTNALIEMLVTAHPDSPLFELTGNPASDEDNGGLDWILDFDGFSDQLRAQARQISDEKLKIQ